MPRTPSGFQSSSRGVKLRDNTIMFALSLIEVLVIALWAVGVASALVIVGYQRRSAAVSRLRSIVTLAVAVGVPVFGSVLAIAALLLEIRAHRHRSEEL